MSSTIDQLGRVTQHLPDGGENRAGQQEMAQIVAETLISGSQTLVEAGTGTGKSLAYLTPVLAEKKRLVVATATIALQGQLADQDVPQVARGLDRDITATVLKGRGNYLCQQRIEEFERSSHAEQLDLLRGSQPDDQVKAVLAWADSTTTGDREELDPAPPGDLWRAVSVGADECPGAARCPAGDRCYSEQARARAREADVIVTNHHYYGLHLATDGALLPEHDVVVFDEAHHLPEVLSATCGSELSGNRFRALGRRVRGVLTDDDLARDLDRTAIDLDNLLRDSVGEAAEVESDLVSTLVNGRDRADRILSGLRKAEPQEGSDAAAKVSRAMQTVTALINDIDGVIEADDNDVLWVDGSANNPILRRTPIDVGDLLAERLWGEQTAVLTSATLPEGLRDQLGLENSVDVHRVGSPFDYERLGLLYCATHLPDPRQPDAREAIREEIVELVKAAGGRSLCLFTSASAMREAAEHVRGEIDYPVLVQGDGSKSALIEQFRADPRTVLLATMSFWQGVDLPGDTLTLVTIDRLPFPRPDDPVLQAKRKLAGPEAFRVVDLPRAQILLAQAAGRLVRRSNDRGVVAVLDTRLAKNRSYRWDLIGALPPFRRTKDRQTVLDYLAELDT